MWFFIATVLLLGVALIKGPFVKETRRFCLKALAIAVVLEATIFNFQSYQLFFSQYHRSSLNISEAALTGVQYDEIQQSYIAAQPGTAKIEFQQVDKAIKTINLDIQLPATLSKLPVSMDVSDATHAAYRYDLAKGDIIQGNERSKIISCEFSGKVSKLCIKLNIPENASVIIKGISVNHPVPVHFSTLRLSLLFFAAVGIYALFHSRSMIQPFEKNERQIRAVAGVITVVFVCAAYVLTFLYQQGRSNGLLSDLQSTSGNQISQELVDAFEKGQVSLLEKPSKELLDLENPYDWSQRTEGISYLWDHCLYNGNYYSYYGIAPVLLLFLPYHLLTGYYFPTPEAVLLFGAVGIVFLTLLHMTFVKKFFPRLQAGIAVMGLIIVQASSGIWFCFASPLFYEIAQSSGFAFVTAGFYFLLSSNVLKDGKISCIRLALATSMLSLAVLCRPTTAVYCVVALAFIWFGFVKLRKQVKQNNRKVRKPYVVYALAALLPFAVIGSVQMLYNYLRFDSVLDFGIQYSLTINDFLQAQYHDRFTLIGFYNYLITPPQFLPEFPFVYSSFQNLGLNGYYFLATDIAVGLFFRALPLFAYLFAGKACKRLQMPDKQQACWLIGLGCIAAPFAVIFSVWESGYGIRYSVDFSWQLLIGALAIAFFMYNRIKHKPVKRIAQYLMVFAVVGAVVVNFALVYTYFSSDKIASAEIQAAFYSFERLFEFWK